MRIVSLFALLSILSIAACHAPTASVMPRIGQFDVGGDIGIQQGSSVSAQNSVDALGLTKDTSVFSGRADLEFGAHLTLTAQSSNHDGDGTADVTFSSGGVVINAGDPVRSELDLGLYTAAVTWDLFPGDTVELGLGLGATVFDIDAKFTDKTTSQAVSTQQTLPVPMLEGRAGVNLGPVELSALLGWIDIHYSGDKASFLDVDAMARVRFAGKKGGVAGYVGAGYRFVNADVSYSDGGDSVDANLDFNGPWIGLALSI
jgi:hypothetical protein